MQTKSIAILSAGHVCIDLCQGAIPALLPFLLIQRHLSYTSAAGLILAANLTSSVVQPLFGRYSDRFQAPWLIPAGLLIAGIGLALTGIAPTYWLIASSIGICGLGVAAFHPEGARITHTIAGERRATGMSLFSVGGSLGLAIGPLVTTLVLVTFGLTGTLILFIPLAALAVVLLLFLRRTTLQQQEATTRGQPGKTLPADAWRPFVRLTGTVVTRSIVFYGLNTFLPLYWIAVLHQSQAAGGFALSLMLFAGVAGTLIGGRLADRYGRKIVVVTSFCIMLPVLLLFVAVSPISTALALVLLVPIGMTLFAPFSVMVVMGQEYIPNHVGTASGVTLGLAVTVGGITAPLFGKIADLYGIHSALLGLSLLPLLALGLALTLPGAQLALAAKE